MIKFSKNIFLALSLLTATKTFAQPATNSPYSQFGLGQLSESLLPQNRSLGGVAAGLRKPGTYNNVNLANPASYSAIQITTFDIGLYTGFTSLSKSGTTETSFTGELNHLVFGVPVTKKSALSFGILPYSTMGFRTRTPGNIDGNTEINKIYNGEGGLSKAYLGYGFQLGKHVSLGANASYLFGKLEKNRDTEFPDVSYINSRNQVKRSLGGFNFDYGAQYFTQVSKKLKLTLGYSGSSQSNIKSTTTDATTRYTIDANGNENIPLDTTYFKEGNSETVKLPSNHRFGLVLEESNKWLIGADVTIGQWSKYREGSTNPGLQNSLGVGVGAQITPDITAVGSYFKLVDYRFGFKYDKSYIKYNNNDIKQYALTLGLGLPLPSNRSTFYKINLGTELGQRGNSNNGLIRERFANIYLGFTLNDRWFQRYKFD